jgi:hypothetical protein
MPNAVGELREFGVEIISPTPVLVHLSNAFSAPSISRRIGMSRFYLLAFVAISPIHQKPTQSRYWWPSRKRAPRVVGSHRSILNIGACDGMTR